MIKVGITGGIGAGKSLITKIFQVLDIPIYYADEQAKRLVVEDFHLIKDIKKLLGSNAYNSDGTYNRKYVGEKVFSNPKLLKGLNQLVHPAVHKDLQSWYSKQTSPYAIEEAALIIESGGHKYMDCIILVTCPKERRIQRVMKRNNISRSQVEERMARQLTDNEKRKHCHFEIINDEAHKLIPQVLHVHKVLTSFS